MTTDGRLRRRFAVFIVSSSCWSPCMGFVASRWRKPETLAHLDEWGLGGRNFGTWITWFLVGGDFYTAYTVIAVPALVYAVGAYGFFALPYTIIVYPFVFAVMPRAVERVAQGRGYVTAADVVHGRYGSRGLELAVALDRRRSRRCPTSRCSWSAWRSSIKALGLHGRAAAGRRLPDPGALHLLRRACAHRR